MDISVQHWGYLPDKTPAHLITIYNNNIRLTVSDYGATFQSMLVKDRSGIAHDIILGYDDLISYYNDKQNFGGTMGRYANRIAGARITLDGREWMLTANEGSNMLHGGRGFNKCMWEYSADSDYLTLSLRSPHLDNGFPGNLTVTQRISLTDHNSILVEYDAYSDMDTVCSLTNHSYFNFSGVKNVAGYTVTIGADSYTPVDSHCIPTGKIVPVDGTVYDFRTPKCVGFDYIDVNYALSPDKEFAATVTDPDVDISMSIRTDFPGLQLYNGNYIGDCIGKYGRKYNDQHGICFEPQNFPDAMHHNNFPSPVIHAGEHMLRYIEYCFN